MNKSQLCIHLNNVEFYAQHGWFEEEKKTGNLFRFQAKVFLDPLGPNKKVNELSETTDYARLFELLQARMKTPQKLLERLLMDIVEDWSREYPFIRAIEIYVEKCTAPIPQLQGTVGVSYHWCKE